MIAQWGQGRTEKAQTFALAFSSTPYSIVVFPGTETSNRYQNLRLSNISKTGYTATMTGFEVTEYYIVVGK